MEDLVSKEGQTTAVLGSSCSPTVAEVLNAAADLLEPEGRWTQGTWARDAEGNNDPIEPPVCWCALGALYQITRYPDLASYPIYDAAETALRLYLGVGTIPEWNDAGERTQTEVVSALRAAASKQVGGGE